MTEMVEAPARKRPRPGERRIQILQAIAAMLEEGQPERVTTAALAEKIGVSEAALYRHFASKAQMYEGLLEFIEDTLFGLINRIEAGPETPNEKAKSVLRVLLGFSDKNPGMTRVLIGEAITFENTRLQSRVNQLISRVEASLRQSLKLARLESASSSDADPAALAAVCMAYVQGRWLRYAKSGFREHPTADLEFALHHLLPD
ncbi:MAG: nucleoid occlusion factor SlmA [Burkholderiaceae bacterium]|jgi:TetR/AcrR family transcriptional regulator